MSMQPLSGTLKALLARIASFEALEVVIVLAASPDRSYTADEIAPRLLRVRPDAVVAVLDALVASGLLVRAAAYHLSSDPATRDAVAELFATWRADPLPIVQELSSEAIERVRSAAVRTFADAFVVRKKDS